MGAKFVRHPVQWDHEFNSSTGEVGRWLHRKGREVQFLAIVGAPKRTGALSRSITVKAGRAGKNNGPVVEVRAGDRKAKLIHDGSRPHRINARGGGDLVFFWPKVGQVVRFPSVSHPGTAANPFLLDALKKVFAKL